MAKIKIRRVLDSHSHNITVIITPPTTTTVRQTIHIHVPDIVNHRWI